jgi:hypothetical protein
MISAVGILERTSQEYVFAYLRRATEVEGFRPFLGFENLSDRFRSPSLFPLFRQRIMNHRRADYSRYMEILGLADDAPPLEVLGRSGGRRPGDGIFLFPMPVIEGDGSTRGVFFLHGLRHCAGALERLPSLRVGEALVLRDEPDNVVNPRALLVTEERGEVLGYVPDLLADHVHQVRASGHCRITVVQVNSPDAPPNLRLLVRLEGRVPEGYRPFSGPDWATVS